MKKNKKSGVSLVEIILAVMIFAIVAIPLYYAVSYSSNEEVQLDKIAIANKILESFRDEIKNLDFEVVKAYGTNIDGSQLPPNSFQALLNSQKKYKDFKFSAEAEHKEATGIESILFKAEVKWTLANGKESSQKLSFVKVQK